MNRIKKIAVVLVLAAFCMGTGCGQQSNVNTEPSISQMRSICDLAVMECYYHNVAKFRQDTGNILPWQAKEKHFWIEYSGVVQLGIDASKVSFEIDGTDVTITIPEATVLSSKVDSASLNEDSFIVDKDSADVTAEDQTEAFAQAQEQLEDNARNDTALLAEAQQRAKSLLEDYVKNIGSEMGVDYTVQWVDLSDGTATDAGNNQQAPSETEVPESSTSSDSE